MCGLLERTRGTSRGRSNHACYHNRHAFESSEPRDPGAQGSGSEAQPAGSRPGPPGQRPAPRRRGERLRHLQRAAPADPASRSPDAVQAGAGQAGSGQDPRRDGRTGLVQDRGRDLLGERPGQQAERPGADARGPVHLRRASRWDCPGHLAAGGAGRGGAGRAPGGPRPAGDGRDRWHRRLRMRLHP